jgi:hypothetical protein
LIQMCAVFHGPSTFFFCVASALEKYFLGL